MKDIETDTKNDVQTQLQPLDKIIIKEQQGAPYKLCDIAKQSVMGCNPKRLSQPVSYSEFFLNKTDTDIEHEKGKAESAYTNKEPSRYLLAAHKYMLNRKCGNFWTCYQNESYQDF